MLKITVRAFAAAVILGVQPASARPPKFRLFSGGGFGFCCAVKREKYSEFYCAHTEKIFRQSIKLKI